MKLNKANMLNVCLKRHGQFRGTQFLILVLNSFKLVEFLYSSGKIIHNFGPKTEMVSVP